MRRRDTMINGERFTLTDLQPYGFSVGIRQWKEPIPEHFVIQTVGSVFDKSLFGFPHTPIVIAEVNNTAKFSRQSDIRVLNCPIKFSGSNKYNVPRELLQFDEALAKCIAYEHAINPDVLNYYAYLTVDQGIVKEDEYQRKAGCHSDGFQGAGRPKRPIARTYSAYDNTPSIFYGQKFITTHLDPARHDFFLSFDEQAETENEMFFPNYSIILSGAYSVHRSAPAETTGYRTFFRLHYDLAVFDQLGNTHNPLFNYAWPMTTRDIRTKLVHKKLWTNNLQEAWDKHAF